jgi:predicted unusual protein kinase regulating ubiquinone biosynthesis (AarF/ABC1/UbiB family)
MPFTNGARSQRKRPPRSRLLRFLSVGLVLARLYVGYRRIGLLQKWRGEGWAEERRHAHHRWCADRLYQCAVRNQGLLIKTAQFLSSRPDIVPDEYIDVLSGLQDEVPPEPMPVVRRLVEAELGRPLEAVFSEFDEEPVASASLAQVHRAVLRDGRVVAVKVQYPGIERLVTDDLKNNDLFIKILSRLDRTLDFSFISEEMNKMIPLELDFIREGQSAEQIAANFAGVEDIVVPEVYWEYTTRRVLVMQFLDGVKVTDAAGLQRLDVDPADIAKVIIVAFSEMLLQHGLFHADPHPGNLLVAPGPKLIMVDFGQVKEVGPQFRFVFAQMTQALVADDNSALGQSFRDLGFRMKDDSADGYRELGRTYVGDIAKEMTATNAGWAKPEMFETSYRDMLRLLRSNPLVKIPPDLLFVGRVMGLLNGLSMTLGSRTNMLVEMARMLERGNGSIPEREEPRARRLLEA